MSKSVLHTIQSQMNGFSKGQKRIAAYILENYDKAAFMTANKLGKTAQVSESTVVRFATELGYDGYPTMQKALQEIIRGKLIPTSTSPGPICSICSKISPAEKFCTSVTFLKIKWK